jgi:hypothetical protein
MKLKCPVCNSCLDYAWVANGRFFNCFLCQVTYNIDQEKLKIVKEIILAKDKNGQDFVERVIYKDDNKLEESP